MATPTVLLADDEPHITHVVARKLRTAGIDVLTAEDGEEALELALTHVPQLVITDLQMPYISGIELAERLAADERTRHVPLIMLTARGYVLQPNEIEATNIRYMMSKPFSAREILEKVLVIIHRDDVGSERASA